MTPSLPRVILVGGAPLSGKSTVARVLADRHRYACIATDDLGAAVRAVSLAREEEAMIAKFVARSLRLDEQLRAAAQQRPLHLVQLMGAEAPEAIADRIEALLTTR
jgi:cytidylate kinase